jgi:type II secretory pathway component PulK
MRKEKHYDSGFILLTSIWLLVLGGAIAAAVMLSARTAVRSVKAAEQQMTVEQGLQSARDQVIADLMQAGRFSRWAQPAASGSLSTGEPLSIDVRVSQEGGRLDLLAAQQDKIDSLFAALDLPTATRESARTSLNALRATSASGKRPLRSLRELAAQSGWTPQLIGCLLPIITIHSGTTAPSSSAISDPLARILDTSRRSDEGGAADSQSVAGELYRIETSARLPQGVARAAWMVRITGDLQQPYWILGSYPGGLPTDPPSSCFKPQTAL